MKLKVLKTKGPARAKDGKFKSGGGGFNTVKSFDWRRSLPTIMIIALVGGLFVWKTFAVDPNSTDGWKLFWSDEFNSSSLDTTRWGVHHDTYGDGNHEEACLTPNNVTVSGGSLKITAKKETITCPGAPTDQFSSGFIGSRDAPAKNYYPAFARYEIRAKVPHGQGLWPAFWLRHVNGSSTAEVDVMEYFHTQVPGKVQQTLHLPAEEKYNLAHQTMDFEQPVDGTGDWHTYRVDIDPLDNGTRAKFTYYVDGKVNFEFTPSKFGWLNNFDKSKMFDIAINMAVGGDWNGHPDDPLGWSRYLNKCINKYPYKTTQPCDNTGVKRAIFPAVYEIDYVRVYEKDNTGGSLTAKSPEELPLAIPKDFTAGPSSTAVDLSWAKSTDTRVSQYSTRYIRSDSADKSNGKAWTYPGRVTGTSQKISGLQNGVKYDFQVHTIADFGTPDTKDDVSGDYSSTITATPNAPAVVATGLSATYYSRTGMTGNFVSRTDKTIDFNWGLNAPLSGIPAEFSVRWTGQIVPNQSAVYTFTTASDDGAMLWIDGKPLIDSWVNQSVTEKTGTVYLEAGKAYDIDMDYFDSGKDAVVKLYWQNASLSKQIVPASVLRPTVKTGMSARYTSRGGHVTNYILRNDKVVDFDWLYGSPSAEVPVDDYRVNWIGKLTVPTSGTYTISSYTDDGAQLWINNDLRYNDWTDGWPRTNSTSLYLNAGTPYALTFRYYEHTGKANAKLLWSGPGIAESVIPTSNLRTN